MEQSTIRFKGRGLIIPQNLSNNYLLFEFTSSALRENEVTESQVSLMSSDKSIFNGGNEDRRSQWFRNIGKIHQDKTYTVESLQEVLDCSVDVIYDLIKKKDIPLIPGPKKYFLLDGGQVKRSLKYRLTKIKKAKENTFHCFKCQKRASSRYEEIKIELQDRRAGGKQLVKLIGKCIGCGGEVKCDTTLERAITAYPHLDPKLKVVTQYGISAKATEAGEKK